MDIVALEAKYENFYAPAFEILVEGKDILRLGQDNTKESIEISNVTIDNILDGADTFSFTVNNPFDITKGEFRSFIYDVLIFNAEVEIRFGYGSQRKTLMFGVLDSVKITFPSGGAPQAEVSGFDISHRMTKEKKPRSWNNMVDSDVVKLIAEEYALKTSPNADDPFTQTETTIEPTTVKHQQIIKEEKESDFEFLTRLAENNYYEFFIFRKTIYFRKPDDKAPPIVTLEWNKSLSSFSPEFNMAERVIKVDVMGQETSDQIKNIIGTAKIENDEIKEFFLQSLVQTLEDIGEGIREGRMPTNITSNIKERLLTEQVKQPVSSKEQAQNMAKSILLKKHEDNLKGSGESIGIPDILAGTNIELKGLGEQFSKIYYLDKTNHSISSSGYKTTFNVKRMPDENQVTLN